MQVSNRSFSQPQFALSSLKGPAGEGKKRPELWYPELGTDDRARPFLLQLRSLLPYRLSTGLVIPESRCAKTNATDSISQAGWLVPYTEKFHLWDILFLKPRMALGTQRWGVRTCGLMPCSRARKEGEGRARGSGAGQRASAPPPWPRAERNPHTHTPRTGARPSA